MVVGKSYGHMVDLLVAYWRGNPPADGAAHYRCRVLEEQLLRVLSSAEARALLAAPEHHRDEIERALARLGESEGE